MRYLAFLFVPIFFQGFVFASEVGMGTEIGTVLEVTSDHTLYDIPGYDIQAYNANQSRFEQLRELGITDLIPRKLAWPKKGQTVTLVEKERITDPNNRGELYLRVKHHGEWATVEGYAKASFFKVASPRAGTEGGTCANCREVDPCRTHQLSVICQANLFVDLDSDLRNFNQNFKSLDERTAYFEKYRKCGKPELFRKYRDEYRHYIAQAAESFQVPEGLLACLLFKENQWDQGRSGSGAIGIAQFMPDNVEYIDGIVRQAEEGPNGVARLQQIKEDYERLVRENLVQNTQGESGRIISPQMRRDYEYASSRLKNVDLAKNWTDYIQKIEVTEVFKKNYPTKPWAGSLPTRFNVDRAGKPVLAIAASAMYLKDIMLGMAKNYDEGSIKGPGQLMNYLVAVSGAYNMGPGTAARLIGTPPPGNTNEWVKKMERNLETTKHMRSIRTCMTKGDDSPPLMIRGNQVVPQRACQ